MGIFEFCFWRHFVVGVAPFKLCRQALLRSSLRTKGSASLSQMTVESKCSYIVNSTLTETIDLRTLKKETKLNTKLNGMIAKESMLLPHAMALRQVAMVGAVAAGETGASPFRCNI